MRQNWPPGMPVSWRHQMVPFSLCLSQCVFCIQPCFLPAGFFFRQVLGIANKNPQQHLIFFLHHFYTNTATITTQMGYNCSFPTIQSTIPVVGQLESSVQLSESLYPRSGIHRLKKGTCCPSLEWALSPLQIKWTHRSRQFSIGSLNLVLTSRSNSLFWSRWTLVISRWQFKLLDAYYPCERFRLIYQLLVQPQLLQAFEGGNQWTGITPSFSLCLLLPLK